MRRRAWCGRALFPSALCSNDRCLHERRAAKDRGKGDSAGDNPHEALAALRVRPMQLPQRPARRPIGRLEGIGCHLEEPRIKIAHRGKAAFVS
jgi:hypothetical protein